MTAQQSFATTHHLRFSLRLTTATIRKFLTTSDTVSWIQAGFFFTYLLTKGILARTIGFLRIPGAVISWLLGKFSTSERAQKRTWANQYMSYGAKVPGDALAILILLVFSFVQPLISVAALVYFILANLYWKYDLMYCFRDSFQTGGMFWPVVRTSVAPETYQVY